MHYGATEPVEPAAVAYMHLLKDVARRGYGGYRGTVQGLQVWAACVFFLQVSDAGGDVDSEETIKKSWKKTLESSHFQ